MQRAALASLIASVLVAASTAGFGTVLLVRGEVVVVSPLMLCMLAGLLVGISLLVVLPQATDSLGAQGWQTESVHVLFLLAPMAMYFIENIMVENTRGDLIHGQLAHVHLQGGGPKGHQVFVVDVSTLTEQAEREPPVKFNRISQKQECQQCGPVLPVDERSNLLAQNGRPALAPRKQLADRVVALKRCSVGFGMGFRLVARIVDAALDGVLLATSTEVGVLIPLTLAICLCSSGDVVCLYVYFTKRNCAKCFKAFAIAMVCLAFPIGTGVTLALLKEFATTLNALRCIVSGLFIYVGFFELMPPIPHGQMNSLKYFLAFSAGLLCAYISDSFEDSFAFVSAMHRTQFHVRPHSVTPHSVSPPSPPSPPELIFKELFKEPGTLSFGS